MSGGFGFYLVSSDITGTITQFPPIGIECTCVQRDMRRVNGTSIIGCAGAQVIGTKRLWCCFGGVPEPMWFNRQGRRVPIPLQELLDDINASPAGVKFPDNSTVDSHYS